MKTEQSCWAIIPAAGAGIRMGLDIPKQYLKLLDKTVLEYSVDLFCDYQAIKGVVVVLSDGDEFWHETGLANNTKINVTQGGVERCHSVQNGLQSLKTIANPDDWVLVHDAARPCIQKSDIDKLIMSLKDNPVGGLLALPVKDTMKRGDQNGNVLETVNRQRLWHALTPQMFRFSLLESAIDNALAKNIIVTDESQAIELYGKQPILIEGLARNIKITNPADLKLAELYLSQQEIKK
ncbi:MAG: 2-C-methyl-D-erythritol 4-phosphate cytidylyltransferase [Gammaproteobacteria bacterium]|jgi:2-C-methyl-D-erythritol 4-phosphate cytidylyltransferase